MPPYPPSNSLFKGSKKALGRQNYVTSCAFMNMSATLQNCRNLCSLGTRLHDFPHVSTCFFHMFSTCILHTRFPIHFFPRKISHEQVYIFLTFSCVNCKTKIHIFPHFADSTTFWLKAFIIILQNFVSEEPLCFAMYMPRRPLSI